MIAVRVGAVRVVAVWALTLVATALGAQVPEPVSGEPPPQVETAPSEEIPSMQTLVAWAEPGEDLARLKDGILRVAAAGRPDEATTWIQLLAVVEGVAPESIPVAVRAVGLAVERQGREGARTIREAAPDLPEADRPALLSMAALLADSENPAFAAEIREALLEAYPEAPEAPEVRLRLARFHLSSEAGRDAALRLLEEVIVNTPQHPIAPEARRLYQANGGTR